jgi:hypothetical protein
LNENQIDRAFCGEIIYTPNGMISKRFWSLGYVTLSKTERVLILCITSDREVFLIDVFVDEPNGVGTVGSQADFDGHGYNGYKPREEFQMGVSRLKQCASISTPAGVGLSDIIDMQ